MICRLLLAIDTHLGERERCNYVLMIAGYVGTVRRRRPSNKSDSKREERLPELITEAIVFVFDNFLILRLDSENGLANVASNWRQREREADFLLRLVM